MKVGAGWQHVKDRSIIDTYATGLFLWAFDNKTFPIAYGYGVGSSDVTRHDEPDRGVRPGRLAAPART